ncbi:MAG TPA: hypothetical protein VGI39_02240 [Polyangiaceae bacterium]
MAKPPGRRTLLSIGTEPTAFINLSPEFVRAIREVAPRARQRLLPIALVALALAWGTAVAGYKVGSHARAAHLAAAPAQLTVPASPPPAAAEVDEPASTEASVSEATVETTPPAVTSDDPSAATSSASESSPMTPRKPERRAPR